MATGDSPEGGQAHTEPPAPRARTWIAVLVCVTVVVVVAGVLGFSRDSDSAGPASTSTSASQGTPSAATLSPAVPSDIAGGGPPVLDVEYCTNDGTELLLDFFPSANSAGPTPVIVYAHGGAWSRGDKGDLATFPSFAALLSAGYSFASIDYRLAPERFPASIIDTKCAIRYLRYNAAAYGIDPEQIVIAGSSAGAHLALMAGFADPSAGFDVGQYSEVSSSVAAVISMSGPAELSEIAALHPQITDKVFGETAADLTYGSPLTYLDEGDPPVLVFQGDLDDTVPVDQARLLDQRLNEAGVEHSVNIIAGLGHRQPPPQYTPQILTFLQQHLG